MKKRLYGHKSGLKSNQLRRLEKLYQRRVPAEALITSELAHDICALSSEIHRQVGLLINRKGQIVFVIVGDQQKIVIPDTSEYRAAPGRLKGLRCVHTHLKQEPLSHDDLTDLALLRLDMMAAVTLQEDGRCHQIHVGHLLPSPTSGRPYEKLPPLYPHQLNFGCLDMIRALESELAHIRSMYAAGQGTERALLVSVSPLPKQVASDSLAELAELASTSGIQVVGTLRQQRSKVDARFILGPGKLQDLIIMALQTGATLVIFDQELNPSQIRSITDRVDLKVIDRTQVILDIFAQRARSREGKLQVELAQLRYLLPRLVTKNTAMSRLTGGIGGRGPGETKLEINRRRVRERILRLEKALQRVEKQRKQQKSLRDKRSLAVVSIVGYTNAGKSTLLNTLTKSRVLAESRLFATLDPSSRRLKFPKDIEVIITDTVGFIKNLPKDLMVAFRATLEELEDADLLLHVIDISNPRFEDQVESVEKILTDLGLQDLATLRVLNKMDRVDLKIARQISRQMDAILISANDETTLSPLMKKLEQFVLNPVPRANE